MEAKKWNLTVVGGTLGILAALAGATLFVDPFLHYRGGQEFLEYPLRDERYQNDGIARHYEYDSIITGTSMCQNFKCSEFDELWGAESVKITNSGASYHESCENIRRALSHNANVKNVLCSLDGNRLNYPAFKDEYEGYPVYLYDDNPFNDVKYLLNKEVIPKTIAVLNYTRSGQKTTTMDEYGSWGSYKSFGKESVLASFQLTEEREEEWELTDEDMAQIRENVNENFVKLAEQHPDTQFYLFFPPYSICWWEAMVRSKQLNAQLEAQQAAAELLLEADNIKVFDFSYRIDIIENLDNYTDTLHYGEWINSELLEMMAAGEGLLTRGETEEYYDAVRELYAAYDYSMYRK
ncbi:MAG: hypothetical protein NC123_19475 [Butyrivibrio sp.]|nr:hypothetical protein [Acetatifactor muris]MCM1561690.1 hypothetical protein [Butyrivibrio sp.]